MGLASVKAGSPPPKLADDQRREPDGDPHACVTCDEVDCICEAEETDLEGDAPSPTVPMTFDEQPRESFTMSVVWKTG